MSPFVLVETSLASKFQQKKLFLSGGAHVANKLVFHKTRLTPQSRIRKPLDTVSPSDVLLTSASGERISERQDTQAINTRTRAVMTSTSRALTERANRIRKPARLPRFSFNFISDARFSCVSLNFRNVGTNTPTQPRQSRHLSPLQRQPKDIDFFSFVRCRICLDRARVRFCTTCEHHSTLLVLFETCQRAPNRSRATTYTRCRFDQSWDTKGYSHKRPVQTTQTSKFTGLSGITRLLVKGIARPFLTQSTFTGLC